MQRNPGGTLSLWLECRRYQGVKSLHKIHCGQGGDTHTFCGLSWPTPSDSRKLAGWVTHEAALSLTECKSCRVRLIDLMDGMGLLDNVGILAIAYPQTPDSNTGVNFLNRRNDEHGN